MRVKRQLFLCTVTHLCSTITPLTISSAQTGKDRYPPLQWELCGCCVCLCSHVSVQYMCVKQVCLVGFMQAQTFPSLKLWERVISICTCPLLALFCRTKHPMLHSFPAQPLQLSRMCKCIVLHAVIQAKVGHFQ